MGGAPWRGIGFLQTSQMSWSLITLHHTAPCAGFAQVSVRCPRIACRCLGEGEGAAEAAKAAGAEGAEGGAVSQRLREWARRGLNSSRRGTGGCRRRCTRWCAGGLAKRKAQGEKAVARIVLKGFVAQVGAEEFEEMVGLADEAAAVLDAGGCVLDDLVELPEDCERATFGC